MTQTGYAGQICSISEGHMWKLLLVNMLDHVTHVFVLICGYLDTKEPKQWNLGETLSHSVRILLTSRPWSAKQYITSSDSVLVFHKLKDKLWDIRAILFHSWRRLTVPDVSRSWMQRLNSELNTLNPYFSCLYSPFSCWWKLHKVFKTVSVQYLILILSMVIVLGVSIHEY